MLIAVGVAGVVVGAGGMLALFLWVGNDRPAHKTRAIDAVRLMQP